MSATPEQRKDGQGSQKSESLDENFSRGSNSNIQRDGAHQRRQNSNLTSQSPGQAPVGVYKSADNTIDITPNLSNLSLCTSTLDSLSTHEPSTRGDLNQMSSYSRQSQGRNPKNHLPQRGKYPIPQTEPHDQSHMSNYIPHNPVYTYNGSQQHSSQYVSPVPSPFWPYDALPTHYNDFNFFVPSVPPPGFWQPPEHQTSIPTPFPVPSASGIIRIDQPLPPSPRPIPEPTQDYILNASLAPYRLDEPTTKLLILDLNGTLLYRPRNPQKDRFLDMRQSSIKPILRPHLPEFMSYIFRNFKIMFWSSATPRNVRSMIKATTTAKQRNQFIASWGRDTFGLSDEEYHKKAITIKDLTKVFKDKKVQEYCKTGNWDVGNTILLDDSVIKASFQPYNHVCVPEFVSNDGEDEKVGDVQDDALWQVAGYLEELRYQGHVARFIKQDPFRLGDGWNGTCLGLE
jgi:hypothetical protein